MNALELTIRELIKNKAETLSDLSLVKRKMAKKCKISSPSNVELLKAYQKLLKKKSIKKNEILENLLRKRKIRSLSGVVVVSVLTKPWPCPGKCIYCPSEPGLPKSYLSGEPAVERAKRANFNPYIQTRNRLQSLKIQGHPIDKIELRIIGGSWSFYPKKYQTGFIAKCFQAANEFKKLKITGVRPLSILQGSDPCQFLEKEQKRNEKTKCRIVGISIETRPDLICEKEILNLRKLGVTMVELGTQTTYDDILEKCQRGHLVQETIKATKLLKDAGFKVMYQIMPNLPGSNPKRDFKSVKKIFENSNFKPDWLKIYPCLVCKGTKLYQMWKKRKYRPYSDKELVELLIKIKQILPYWVRLARLFRDIPAQKIEAGSKISNLRQVVQREMEKRKMSCHCIRCREVKANYNPKEKIFYFRRDYDASCGREIFLSFENKNRSKLYSLLRLRLPLQSSSEARPRCCISVLKNAAVIRELHTYGQMTPIAGKKIAAQHRGLGKKLIKQAEKISKKEFKLSKIAVISGIGAREYYRKLGYRLQNTYMIKTLK